jgi:membrane peptidoglycan carboxypeptidase
MARGGSLGMPSKWKWALVLPLAVLLLFIAYEGLAVLRARSHTPAALASVADRPLRLAALSPQRRAWLLAVEDPGFYRHHGVDFSTPGAGMTTITQAMVKRLYFDDFHPGFPKIEQSLIAWLVLDRAVSKDELLEIFLNHVRFGGIGGREVIGFEDAARSFYGRPVARLSDREYLSLVAMLMAPAKLDLRRHPRENAERVARIEALLAGRCRPSGLRDVQYARCAASS